MSESYTLEQLQAMAARTPMMRQYLEFKELLPSDTLLAFRLGDFYEFFFGDAEEVARILGYKVTRRNTVPMTGFPYYLFQDSIEKLTQAGKNIAIAEMDDDGIRRIKK